MSLGWRHLEIKSIPLVMQIHKSAIRTSPSGVQTNKHFFGLPRLQYRQYTPPPPPPYYVTAAILWCSNME